MTTATRTRTLAFVVLVAVLALLAGILVWSNAFAPRPIAAEALPTPRSVATEPASPTPTEAPDVEWTVRSPGGGRQVTVRWELLKRLEMAVGKYDGYIAFTSGQTSRSFHGPNTGRGTGLRIVDATTARPHYNQGRPLGEDAASFIEGLQTNERIGIPELGPVSAARLSGLPAWSVDLLGPVDYFVHLDAGQVSINLHAPSRLIVADMGSAIILVQIWAGSEADFERWVAQAEGLLESLRIDVSP